KAGKNERYLPYAIGDGAVYTLNICAYPGWASFLKPSVAALECFTSFQEQASVKRQRPAQTFRLDALDEIAHIDFLKVDVQGSELDVLRGGAIKLRDAAVVQVEVPFVALYDGQPTFSNIDRELRAQ